MTAWQHPMDQCEACGQDILLRPEVTEDTRLAYMPYCPRCDAGEPVVVPRQRTRWADDPVGGVPSSWISAEPALRAVTAASPSPRPVAGSASASARSRGGDPQSGVDLWWDGGDGGGRHRSEDDSLDAKWARFVAGSEEDDEEDAPASEGSFAFGGEDVPRRRRMRFGLRKSA